MKQTLTDLINKKDLTNEQATSAMEDILNGNCKDSQIAAFITLLRSKGETVDELSALVKSMWSSMPEFEIDTQGDVIDTCGTGGSTLKTFNISTCVSFILAALDVKVAKHGNRAVSSKSGAADVLEVVGFNLELQPKKVAELFNEVGFGFLLAPIFHPGMRFAKNVREELAVRTTFNFIGPLANPFKANIRLHGVSDPLMVDKYIETLKQLGVEKAIVFSSQNSLDEINLTGITKGKKLENDSISDFEFLPEEYDLEVTTDEDIKGGEPQFNAVILNDVMSGKKTTQRSIVVANAAVAYSLVKNISISDAIARINEVLDNKQVEEKYRFIIERSNSI